MNTANRPVEIKLRTFKRAGDNFSYLVNVDLKSLENVLDERLIEGILHGKVHKFECLMELCWKLIKDFLRQEDGVDAKTPKQAVKEFYLAGHIDESNYLTLFDMIDHRNLLSHTYDEEEFQAILSNFPKYALVFKQIEKVVISKSPAKDSPDKVKKRMKQGIWEGNVLSDKRHRRFYPVF